MQFSKLHKFFVLFLMICAYYRGKAVSYRLICKFPTIVVATSSTRGHLIVIIGKLFPVNELFLAVDVLAGQPDMYASGSLTYNSVALSFI